MPDEERVAEIYDAIWRKASAVAREVSGGASGAEER